MRIYVSHVLGIIWISASPEIFQKPINLKYLFFSHAFPALWKPNFPMFWELNEFLLHMKNFKNA